MYNKYYSLFVLILCAWFCVDSCAAVELPEKAMGKPKVFNSLDESYRWNEIAKLCNWGELSRNYWRVYIDREGVRAHETPNANSRVIKTLKFMNYNDVFYVAKVQNRFALLYSEKYQQGDLKISSNATAIGWVSVDELLLWSDCPRTANQVYKKAVILKEPSLVQDKSQINNQDFVSPKFYASPEYYYETGFRAIDLEFYFVYKEDENGSALLMPDSKITDNVMKDKHGWMRSGFYTPWNVRLCFESNYNSSRADKAAVFKTKEQARAFKTGNADFESEGDVFFCENTPTKRWSPNVVRFPVLKDEENGLAYVGTICSFGKSGGGYDNPVVRERARTKLNALRKMMNKINIVFVIDGTSSMEKYYQPLANAMIRYMSQNDMKGVDVQFGAVVYRNYEDEKNGNLVEICPLTSNYQTVANWIVARKCMSDSKDPYEATLYGLNYAVDKMSWSAENCNFMVVVGDAASRMPDKKGLTVKAIADKLSKKHVNLVVFQANHPSRNAYDDFPSQMKEIMGQECFNLTGKNMTKNDIKYDNQMRLYMNENPEELFPIFSSGYRYAAENASEDANMLERIIENRMSFFRETAGKNRQLLEMSMGNGVNKFPEGVKKYLKSLGFTDDELTVMSQGVLKIKGYTSRMSNGKEAFVSSVFMTQDELNQLISSLKKVSSDISGNRRVALQEAMKQLIATYFGNNKNTNSLTAGEVMEQVIGLQGIAGLKLLDIDIDEITNPNSVSDTQIDALIKKLSIAVSRLEEIKEDKTCYYISPNGVRYYYILVDDMPLVQNER